MWDFFIAHASADISAAEVLYELLVRDHKTFLDKRCIPPGADWDEELREAQRQSLVTVLLVSPNTVSAYYQREEIANAVQRSRDQTQQHDVVPVYLDDDADSELEIPYGLRLKQSIRLSQVGGLSGAAQELSKLLIQIRRNSLEPTAMVGDESGSASTTDHVAILETAPMSGALVVGEDRVYAIWKACLNEILHPDSTTTRYVPLELEEEPAILDLLAQRFDFIMLPLTLEGYNSIRLAEHAHRLDSPSRIILCSSTNAPRDALDGLFDSYVPTREFSARTIARAIAQSVNRSLSFEDIERRIEVILGTATCFIVRAWHPHEADRPATLKDYRFVGRDQVLERPKDALSTDETGLEEIITIAEEMKKATSDILRENRHITRDIRNRWSSVDQFSEDQISNWDNTVRLYWQKVMILFEDREYREDFEEWHSHLNAKLQKVDSPELKNNVEALIRIVEQLRVTFYGYYRAENPPELYSAEEGLMKNYIMHILESEENSDEYKVKEITRKYIEHLDNLSSSIGRIVGTLKGMRN